MRNFAAKARASAWVVSLLSLLLVFVPRQVNAVTSFTECKFSSYQAFDVQWSMGGGNLYISGVTTPYDSGFSQPNIDSGDYFQFFESTTNPGTYGLKLFNSDGSLQQIMHNTGDFSALGSDFLFYQGSGFFGTVITTTQGLAYGSSATLPVSQENPTNQQVSSFASCSSTPIAQVGPAPTTTTVVGTTTTTTTAPSPSGPNTDVCATSYQSSNFVLGGSSTDSSGTITLTQPAGNQFGAIWSRTRVDIATDFCIHAEVFLGNSDSGADGLAFVMQPNSVAAGTTGGGLGYMGISPSFAVEYDTWPNSGDPYNDHIGLMKNGATTAHSEWGTSAVDVGNIEDGQWRKTKIYWDSFQDSITVFLDNNADGDITDSGETLFSNVPVDLGGLFAGSSGFTYWGFTAATGGSVNLQQVRNITYAATSRSNSSPTVSSAPTNSQASAGEQTVIPFTLSDDSTSAGQWVVTATSGDTSILPQSAISVSMISPTAGEIIISPTISATAGTVSVVLSAIDADGASVTSTFSVAISAYVGNSLRVTSLADTNTTGTLRWAINQANAQNGGIYDSISFATGLSGTISLTSALPSVIGSLTITGNGQTNIIIDGNNAYRPFWVGQGNSLTISNMTLKRGPNSDGGLIFNTKGNVSATNVRFTQMSGGTAVFNKEPGSVATYTNCTFDYLNIGIGGDHGSTPSLPAGVTTWANQSDSVFQNRTYVVNSTFANNSMAINSQRFTKIQDSTFTNNTYGAALQGWNRGQILNSTFTNNGIAIYHSSWISPTANMGIDNRLIDGNTFTNNGTSIYLDDAYNNGQKYQGWSTVRNNSWDNQGNWVVYYLWNGSANTYGSVTPTDETTVFTQSSNTVVLPPYYNAVQNLTATTNTDGSVSLDWDAPSASNLQPHMYDISWVDLENGVESGGWGVWTYATNTTYSVGSFQFPQTTGYGSVRFKVRAGNAACVGEGSGSCVYGPYVAVDSVANDPSASGTATPAPAETTTAPAPAPLEPLPSLPLPESDPQMEEETPVEQEPSTEETIPEETESSLPEQEQPETEEQITIEEDSSDNSTVEEIIPQLDEIAEITPEEAVALVEDISELEPEQIAEVIEQILEEEITEELAIALVTSSEVLETLTNEQAEEVFSSIEQDSLTEEQAAAIVAAIQEAPVDVKEAFESELNVYGGQFDTYVPLGSTIDVGTRRAVLAVNLVTASIAIAATGLSSQGPSSGPTSTPKTSSGELAARREDEEEEGGEIAGDGLEWIKAISIYKIVNGQKVINWSAFMRKFLYSFMNLGFTIAGAIVLFYTLSGVTRTIAMWSFGLAFAAAMYLAMKEPDEG